MNSLPLVDEASFLGALTIAPANSLPLDDEMKGILARADELARELDTEYKVSAGLGVVTERARNLFHEVLVKLRSSLDFVMCRIYNKHSSLQGVERAKGERRAGLPICDAEDVFNRKLKSLGLSHLAEGKSDLYAKLRQSQPFLTKKATTKNNSLVFIRELSNLGKHVRMAKQDVRLRPARRFTGPDGQVAIATEGVVFNDGKSDGPWSNCTIENVTWATFVAYTDSGEPIFPEPVFLCLELRLWVRSYVQEIVALI